MKTKRIMAFLLILGVLLSLAGCAGGTKTTPAPTEAPAATPAPTEAPAPAEEPAPAPEAPAEPTAEPQPGKPDTVEFTDDTGRTLTLPRVITKIAVSGPLSQIVVFALAPELLVAVSNAWDPGAEEYFDPVYFNLPVLGQLYGGKGELNLEELLAAGPQLVLDVGEAKANAAEDLDALTQQTGIPFIHIDADTESTGEAYRKLGSLLGLEDRAEVLADYCEETYAWAQQIMEQVGSGRLRLLYLLGDKGLNVIAQGSYHGEILELVGENAAVVDNPSSKGTGNETDLEQLLLWDPEFIIFSYDSVGSEVADDPLWQQLTAIREGNWAVAPFGPYNWMGFPPSVQRYPGILWLLQTLYPEAADYDLYSEVNRFFDLFYHCTLTPEQYAKIVG